MCCLNSLLRRELFVEGQNSEILTMKTPKTSPKAYWSRQKGEEAIAKHEHVHNALDVNKCVFSHIEYGINITKASARAALA